MTDQIELLKKVRQSLQAGNYVDAITALERIVTLERERGNDSAVARHLGNLALTHYRLGNPQKALTHFREGLAAARRGSDRLTENGILGNMGNILREVGQMDEAEKYLDEALALSQELGDTRGRGIWLSNLGLLYDDLTNYDEAIGYHERSVAIARELNDKMALAARLSNLGNSYIEKGDIAGAIPHFEEALRLHKLLGNRQEIAMRTGILGNLYGELGRNASEANSAHDHFKTALDYYGEAMEYMRAIGDRASEAEVIRSIGNVLADAGQYDDAAQYLDVATQMFDALGLSKQAEHNRKTLTRLIEFLEREESAG